MELSLSISGLILFITSTYKIKLGFNYSAGKSFADKGIPICLTFDMSSAQQEGIFFRWLAGAMSWITQSIHKKHFLPQHRLGCFVFIFLAHGLIFPLFIGGGRAPSLPPWLFWVFIMLSTIPPVWRMPLGWTSGFTIASSLLRQVLSVLETHFLLLWKSLSNAFILPIKPRILQESCEPKGWRAKAWRTIEKYSSLPWQIPFENVPLTSPSSRI